jgi:hypothetical protein
VGNGSFTRTTWTVSGTGADVSANAPIGALKSEAIIYGGFFIRLSTPKTVTPRFQWWNSGGSPIGSAAAGPAQDIPANTWTWVQGEVAVPAGVQSGKYYVTTNMLAGETYDAVGAVITHDGPLSGYFDGDSPGATWSGAPDASISSMGFVAAIGHGANPVDDIGITESVLIQQAASLIISDDAGLTDSAAPSLNMPQTFGDVVGLTDEATVVVAIQAKPATEPTMDWVESDDYGILTLDGDSTTTLEA